MRRKTYKAIVGIEAAIVLIAFVVVAAALAFVVLNMGFYTTQRSKEVMGQGLAQASSALEIDGTVLAEVDTANTHNLSCVVIPVRLSAGQKDVDLTPGKADIAVWVINKGGITNAYNVSPDKASPPSNPSQAVTDMSSFDIDSLCKLAGNTWSGVAIVWRQPNNNDTVLQAGEKILVVVNFSKLGTLLGFGNGLQPYDVFKVEIKPPIGSALTVERTVPASLTYSYIDLG
ncbi:MAG: flagellin [Desulfurococcaceae archaeon]|nr:flagellin [Desulfurococcaceae archaeon]